MQLSWQELIATSSVLSLFLVVWWLLEPWVPPISTNFGKMIYGALLGLTTILGMSMAPDFIQGFKFDLRHALIASSGLFGGPISAIFTALFSIVYRISLGGAGVIPGILGILITAVIGCIGYFLAGATKYNFSGSITFSVCVTLGVLASFFAIDESLRYALLGAVWAPFLTLTFCTTLVTALLLRMDLSRREAFAMNETYAAMVESLPDSLNVKDLDGHFIVVNEATARLMRAESANEMIGRTDFDYYPEELARQYRQDELAVIRAEETKLIEQRVTFHSGEKGWLSTVKVPMRNGKGEIIGLTTHNRDITAQYSGKSHYQKSESNTNSKTKLKKPSYKLSYNRLHLVDDAPSNTPQSQRLCSSKGMVNSVYHMDAEEK